MANCLSININSMNMIMNMIMNIHQHSVFKPVLFSIKIVSQLTIASQHQNCLDFGCYETTGLLASLCWGKFGKWKKEKGDPEIFGARLSN